MGRWYFAYVCLNSEFTYATFCSKFSCLEFEIQSKFSHSETTMCWRIFDNILTMPLFSLVPIEYL